jgi:hypothetical protein
MEVIEPSKDTQKQAINEPPTGTQKKSLFEKFS